MDGCIVAPAGKWLLSLGCACLCACVLGPVLSPLQLLAARDRSRTPNTFPFCPLFLFPPSRPSTHGSLCHLPTHAKLPWSQPQTPLVQKWVNVLRSADGLSFALHLATYALGHIPFLFNQLCPPPHSGFSPIIIITITPHGLFRSFALLTQNTLLIHSLIQ